MYDLEVWVKLRELERELALVRAEQLGRLGPLHRHSDGLTARVRRLFAGRRRPAVPASPAGAHPSSAHRRQDAGGLGRRVLPRS